MMWKKKRVWIVTIWLREMDEGIWDVPFDEFLALTYEDAERMRSELLSGESYYGDLVEHVEISDNPEIREVWV